MRIQVSERCLCHSEEPEAGTIGRPGSGRRGIWGGGAIEGAGAIPPNPIARTVAYATGVRIEGCEGGFETRPYEDSREVE